MGHLFTSLAAALKCSWEQLAASSRVFSELLRIIKYKPTTDEERLQTKYAQGKTAVLVHRNKAKYPLLPTAKNELHIICTALQDVYLIKILVRTL